MGTGCIEDLHIKCLTTFTEGTKDYKRRLLESILT